MLNLWAGISLLALYLAVLAVYRLYFNPLATIPGCKLAVALTPRYNAYNDLVRGGQYVWVIEEMHRKFGPIVGTRPDAIHICDPTFIEDLYPQNPKRHREKFHTGVKLLMTPGSISGIADHDLHRRRWAVLNQYFSQHTVRHLEPTINAPFFGVLEPHRVTHLVTHVPWLAKILKSIPPALMTILVSRIGVFEQFLKDLADTIEVIRNSKEIPEGRIIFHEIIRSDNLPETEKETQRITDEAMVILFAETDTIASTLAAIVCHMLADRNALTRLQAELGAFIRLFVSFPGATHRQERAAPDEDLVYKDVKSGRAFVIPTGMGYAMANYQLSFHPIRYEGP
ncbi:cytochrome P450 [Trichoderma evansii]